MITLYVYRKSDRLFLYSDTCFVEWVLDNIDKDNDFTLTPPPNTYEKWHWYDSAWQSELKPTAE